MQKLDRAFHERVALDLLARDGIGVVWKLHLDAANAYRRGYPRGAQIRRDRRRGRAIDPPRGENRASEEYGMTGTSVFRTTLLTISTAFGALGIFLLSYSGLSAPVGDYAVVFLAMAWAIAWFADKLAEGS